jgi:hypothetical protein
LLQQALPFVQLAPLGKQQRLLVQGTALQQSAPLPQASSDDAQHCPAMQVPPPQQSPLDAQAWPGAEQQNPMLQGTLLQQSALTAQP